MITLYILVCFTTNAVPVIDNRFNLLFIHSSSVNEDSEHINSYVALNSRVSELTSDLSVDLSTSSRSAIGIVNRIIFTIYVKYPFFRQR